MDPEPVQSSFGLLWFIATIMSLVLCFILYLLIVRQGIIDQLQAALSPITLLGLVGIICVAPISIAQSFILRQRIRGTEWWIVSTAIGWLIFLGFWSLIPPLGDITNSFGQPILLGNFNVPVNILFNLNAFVGAGIGLAFGLVQWQVLNGKVQRAYQWVAISTAAYAVGLPIASTIISVGANVSADGFAGDDFLRFIFAGLTSGVIIAAITHFGLMRLLEVQSRADFYEKQVANLRSRRLWIVITTLGFALAFVIYAVLLQDHFTDQFSFIPPDFTILMLVGTICFAPIGFLQGLALRRQIVGMNGWIVSTIAGWIVFVLVWQLIPPLAAITFPLGQQITVGKLPVAVNIFFNANTFAGVGIGLTFGVVQWLMLLRKVPRAHWWIAVSTIAFGVAIPIASGILTLGGELSASALSGGDAPRFILAGLIGGIICAAITERGLDWLLQPQLAVSERPIEQVKSIARISAADTHIGLKELARTMLVAAVVLLIADLVLGQWMDRYFPETPLLQGSYSPSIGLDKFWKLSETNKQPIVFVGSSSTFEGVAPKVFDAAILETTGIGVNSVDVSFVAAHDTESRDVIRDVVLPRNPTAVFYMAELRAFGWYVDEIYMASPLGSTLQMPPGLPKTLALWLVENSAFIRYRNNLHDLITGQRALQPQLDSFGYVEDDGYFPRIGAHATDWADLEGQSYQYDFTKVGQPNRDALADIIADCGQTQTRCIIVQMPVFHTVTEMIKPGDFLQFSGLIRDSVAGSTVAFWDFNTDACRAALGIDGFADPVHLNIQGAARFTNMLAARYASQYMNAPLPDDDPAQCGTVFHN